MATTGARSRVVLALVWLVVGAAMVAVPFWLGWTRWEAILNGHPAMLVLAIACGLAGFVAVAWSVATLLLGEREPDEEAEDGARPPSEGQRRRRARRRVALAIPVLVVCVGVVGLLTWARPLAATPPATAAMRSGADVQVTDRLTWFEMVSVAKNSDGAVVRPTVGLVFVPGARVDPRAYARVLRPLARAGYLVAVLKEPFGVAFGDADHAGRVMQMHPEIGSWVVGGHSLGGVVAASFAQQHPTEGGAAVAGLVLYASYPAGKVDRQGLRVTSVSGERDGLTTPRDVAASKADLPADSSFVVLPGAVHSDFGDYGVQPGDNQPTTDRVRTQAAIAGATQRLLVAVTPRARK